MNILLLLMKFLTANYFLNAGIEQKKTVSYDGFKKL